MTIKYNNEVLPQYLAWYLTSKEAQAFFRKYTKASTVATINKGTLMEMTVKVPSLDIQQKIVKVAELLKREDQLTRKMLEKKKTLVNSLSTFI